MQVRIGRITIKPPWRNHAYSLGLQYVFVYGQYLGRWLVWHRGSGIVEYIVPSDYDWLEERNAMKKCHEVNGCSLYPDAETLNAIDMTP